MVSAERCIAPNELVSVSTEVITVLREALLALGEAGYPIQANRLAARAWSSLRSEWPEHAETINRTMHVLARLEANQPVESGRPDAGSLPLPHSPTTEKVH